MLTINIDPHGGAWSEVRNYVQARVAELTAVCISVASTDSERQQAACRIDELQSLIDLPARTKGLTEHRLHNQTREVY